MTKYNILLLLTVGAHIVTPVTLSARDGQPDTIATRNLEEVVVTATRPRQETIPTQALRGEELERLNSNNIADALRYFAGVQVKDYGGVGGIKTVNIRSMGTNHTGVVYDGVQLGNAQNGQIDLGQFSLDNIEE
ncbi:MAG: TonB-dependent receptor plug domain-containing protein, partial [Muribaculaceae bacterium]|nr:TonB-dependent receptor plug domain-containing protein [Muribaculaceae bacterium]